MSNTKVRSTQPPAGPRPDSDPRPTREEIAELGRRITQLIQDKPEKSAKILSEWVNQPRRDRFSRKSRAG